jgi:hypothetical protein
MPDIYDLWNPAGGGHVTWYERLPLEVQLFLQRVAEIVVEKGREPNWAGVLRRIRQEWPDYAPSAVGTVKDTVRRLVETSG